MRNLGKVKCLSAFLISSFLIYQPGYAKESTNIAKRNPFGPARAGGSFPGLESRFLASFNDGLARFNTVDSVLGTEPGAPDPGLGPRFNMNSCGGCHAFPATGGTSPATNPQVAVATRFGALNKIPSFITLGGPIREARFIKKPDGTPDGHVHQLFVITGRQDAGACNIQQPDFATQQHAGNVIFRIPTPVFGLGLVSLIPDEAILENMAANAAQKQALGISGHPNISGNDGTIMRFGWKAQNKSLNIFAAEAYNVEMGVTNFLFYDENDQTPGCAFNPTPEDHDNYAGSTTNSSYSDTTQFANFMRFLAAPTPLPPTSQTTSGLASFIKVGCNMCHTQTFTTVEKAQVAPSMSNQPVNIFSDLIVHHMGTGLADGISQGTAGPDEFRTAPLWGIGQRLFFLHDGRATDLNTAIQAHSSSGSEANTVIANFNKLSATDQANVIAFLESL